MFGVVLWSDRNQNRAVIWCEDHGDLAFFKGDGIGAMDGAEMEPGDLVQFDISKERHMRLARNPRLVASDEYPTLASDLKRVGDTPSKIASTPSGKKGAKIIAFDPKQTPSQTGRKPKRRAV